jgi:hypothetical protein
MCGHSHAPVDVTQTEKPQKPTAECVGLRPGLETLEKIKKYRGFAGIEP